MSWCVFGKLPGKDFERIEPKFSREEQALRMQAEWVKVSKPGSIFEVREIHEKDQAPVRRVPRMVKA